MTNFATKADRLPYLAAVVCDKIASQDDLVELDALLFSDKNARRRYLDYCQLHFTLALELRANWLVQKVHQHGNLTPELPIPAPSSAAMVVIPPTVPSPAPTPPVLTPTLPNTIGFFSSGWPVAYLIATVICGIGLVVGAHIYVSQPALMVDQSPPASKVMLAPGTKTQVVGWITGMIDCKWNDAETAPKQNARVSLGCKYTLTSGLLEITYDTGAKVILQGPVKYEVEAKNSGFMSVGKLTGKVTTKTAHGFTIHTPTATVTDLGTEFGVEVNKEGSCEVHVLKGLVRAEFHRPTGEQPVRLDLRAGEARRYQVERGQSAQQQSFQLTIIPVNRAKYQQMHIEGPRDRYQSWQAYSRQLRKDPALVAYYAFEKANDGNTQTLPNLSRAGKALDGRVEGAEWVYGRLPGKLALLFHGPGSGDKVVLPEPDRFEFPGAFSVAMWFKIVPNANALRPELCALLAKGDSSWRLHYSGAETPTVRFATNDPRFPAPAIEHYQTVIGRTNVVDGRWHLVVAVYKPEGNSARKRLYIDGRLDIEGTFAIPRERNDVPLWLGAMAEHENHEFLGQIDEVAIFSRELSTDEAMEMFNAGDPALSTAFSKDDKR